MIRWEWGGSEAVIRWEWGGVGGEAVIRWGNAGSVKNIYQRSVSN